MDSPYVIIDPEAVVGHFITINRSEMEILLMFCYNFGLKDYVCCFCDFLYAWVLFVFSDETFHSVRLYSIMKGLHMEDAHV